MIVIGVDVGKGGAIAVINGDGSLKEVIDMPVLRDVPAGRSAINAPLLSSIFYEFINAEHAFVERVGARPGEGAVGAFSFGRSLGLVEGVLAALHIPVTFISPASWKRAVGLIKSSKDASRSEACRRWPAHAALFKRVKDHGRAEACLIAIAGLRRIANETD